MKRSLLFHALVVLMLILSLHMPLQCLAQQSSVALDAKTDAEYDAEDDVNTTLWLAAGGILGTAGSFLLGSIAMGGAYVYQPVPPAERLLGKSAEYVSFYTDAYKARIRRLQLVAAIKGAAGGTAVFCLLGMLNIKPWSDFVTR
ncbi:MAG: hypothetical protein OXH00_07930 [Candidatus Poribacteria bacterium]|nr:hypothetical protein [Candidatus Poribacteria bacterium]